MQMTLLTDSPKNSSNDDDFIAHLDSVLDASSPDAAPSSKEVENQDESEIIRIKSGKIEGTEETQGSTSHEFVEESLEVTVKKDVCLHPGSFGDICICCRQKVDGESSVTFEYLHEGLRLCDEENSRLHSTDMKNLFRHKKLHLVLDLDHTLLNSTHLAALNSEEVYLLNQTDSLTDVSEGNLFQLANMPIMIMLRPFVRTFLKEASEMFEMYIYNMGDRSYELEMTKLLDPKVEYFHPKVISRVDGTQKNQKDLDNVPVLESAVLILDDTENAWMKHKDNLILMERYHFFASSCQKFDLDCQSLAALMCDECESDGALARILKVLKQAHYTFFDELKDDHADRDVRQVLRTLKSEVLKGCVLVLGHIVHANLPALGTMAEQVGATCLTEVDSSVTHVVATDAGTETARWAVKEKKFLAHPRWIEAANYFWQKQSEDNFTLQKMQ